jgi:hypothetical protein
MILAPPCDCRIELVHVLGLPWHDGVHLRFMPKVVPLVLLRSGEDMVLLDDGRIVVITLVRLVSSRSVLVVILTFSWLF